MISPKAEDKPVIDQFTYMVGFSDCNLLYEDRSKTMKTLNIGLVHFFDINSNMATRRSTRLSVKIYITKLS